MPLPLEMLESHLEEFQSNAGYEKAEWWRVRVQGPGDNNPVVRGGMKKFTSENVVESIMAWGDTVQAYDGLTVLLEGGRGDSVIVSKQVKYRSGGDTFVPAPTGLPMGDAVLACLARGDTDGARTILGFVFETLKTTQAHNNQLTKLVMDGMTGQRLTMSKVNEGWQALHSLSVKREEIALESARIAATELATEQGSAKKLEAIERMIKTVGDAIGGGDGVDMAAQIRAMSPDQLDTAMVVLVESMDKIYAAKGDGGGEEPPDMSGDVIDVEMVKAES
jgi:hypothetical protein